MSTPTGPRSRTLATFRSLTDDAIDRAVNAATTRIDAELIRAAAARIGAPQAEPRAEAAARTLVAEIAAGRMPSEAMRQRLAASLARPAIQSAQRHPSSADDWRGASLRRHAESLQDLLDLTDHLPPRRKPPLRFPRLTTQSRIR